MMEAEIRHKCTDVVDFDNNRNKRQCPPRRSESICNLSEDLLIEILSYLPASSLSTSRFVCKKWLALITTDALLAELHLHRGFKSSGQSIVSLSIKSRGSLLTLMNDDGSILFSCKGRDSLLTLMDEAGSVLRCKHITSKTGSYYNHVSPSCNGLLCIYDESNIALFNPTTQENLFLPKPTEFSVCFLGYLPTTKQYKVVRFLETPELLCEVLTVGTDSWRQTSINFVVLETRGVVKDGFIYFLVISMETEFRKPKIMSFDLKDESFQTVQYPAGHYGDDYLIELDDNLCLVRSYRDDTIEIWMMKDIRSRDWIHLYTLDMLDFQLELKFGAMVPSCEPVLINQRKVLMKLDDGLYYRDAETFLNFPKIYEVSRGNLLSAQAHTESIVSFRCFK